MAKQYDVIIVGAGLVGALQACLLAKHSLSVALVDGHSGHVELSVPPNYDTRVSAISAASQQLLSEVGVWSRLAPQRLSTYQSMQVWDGLGTGQIGFDPVDNTDSELGVIVENAVLQQALLQQINTQATIDLYFGQSPVQMQVADNQVSVSLSSGQALTAALLIGADGAQSWVRQQAGFNTVEWDYGHHAIVATVEIDAPHENTAWQAFGEEGILAFLPLPSVAQRHFVSIVWSVPPLEAQVLYSLQEQAFCQRLTYALNHRFTAVALHSPRHTVVLRQRHATQYVQSRVALIGDAAHTIHPLAGQGANIGFADAGALAQILYKAHLRADDLGRHALLRRYQRERMVKNIQMSAAMEAFKRLYSTQQPALVLARNMGMHWLSQSSWFKQRVVQQAKGIK